MTGGLRLLCWPGSLLKPTPEDLWRDKLMPLGVELIGAVLDDLSVGRIVRRPQDPAYATWEPSWDRPPAFRHDLDMIGALPMGYSVVRDDIQ
jgi:methionyl-tRNA formyltransferase